MFHIYQRYAATLGNITQLCGYSCATKITSDYAELCGIVRRIIVTSLFCRITKHLPLFQLKLKTFPFLHRCDHFVSRLKFLKYLMYSPFVESQLRIEFGSAVNCFCIIIVQLFSLSPGNVCTPRFSIFVNLCTDPQDFYRSLQICAHLKNFCRSLQICADSKETNILRNTIKTPQRCQKINKNV